jgi:hypothetical protein
MYGDTVSGAGMRKIVSTQLLQIALLNQTLDVSLTDVELTVLGEVDGPVELCK